MKRTSPPRVGVQRGLTLIELMVTIVIALLLILVIGSVYLAGKKSFNYQNATGRMQERARYAMGQISQSMRSVGFQGCGSLTTKVGNMTWAAAWSTSLPAAEANWWLLDSAPLRAYATKATISPYTTDFNLAEDSKGDILIAFHPESSTEQGITGTIAPDDDIPVADNPFDDGDILVAYDCAGMVVFQKTGGTATTIQHGASGTPGNCNASFTTSCGSGGPLFGLAAGGFVSRLAAEAYYIAPATSGGGSSLWRRRLQGGTTVAEEIVPRIEGLRVRFGIDNNGDKTADQYLRPNLVAAADWGRVVSARVELLAVSDEQNLASTAQTGIQLDGDASARTTADRRLYRVYSSTINLRNRTY